MTLALPTGWIDTGITGNYSVTGSVQIQVYFIGLWSAWGVDTVEVQIGQQGQTHYIWGLNADYITVIDSSCPGNFYILGRVLRVENSIPSVVETFRLPCAPYANSPSDPPVILVNWSRIYDFTENGGPYRLGCAYQPISGHSGNPRFAQSDYEMIYGWFADPSTLITTTFDNLTAPTYSPSPSVVAGPFQSVGTLPISYQIQPISRPNPPVSMVYAKFSNLSINGIAVDTSELNDGVLVGQGSGAINGILPVSISGSSQVIVTPPFQFGYDLSVPLNGRGLSGAHILDNFVVPTQAGKSYPQASGYLPEGKPAPYVVQRPSWSSKYKSFSGGPLSFSIASDWAAARDPALPTGDLHLPIRAAPAKLSPTAKQHYNPVSLSVSASIELDRPMATGLLTGWALTSLLPRTPAIPSLT